MYGVLPVVFAALLHNVINARLQAQLLQRAMTDPLTGALSRHALADGALGLIAGVRGGGGALAVIMVDLDHFKQINDLHGHAGGDAVLRHAARSLQAQLRLQALLVRYGGEEFVALVPPWRVMWGCRPGRRRGHLPVASSCKLPDRTDSSD